MDVQSTSTPVPPPPDPDVTFTVTLTEAEALALRHCLDDGLIDINDHLSRKGAPAWLANWRHRRAVLCSLTTKLERAIADANLDASYRALRPLHDALDHVDNLDQLTVGSRAGRAP